MSSMHRPSSIRPAAFLCFLSAPLLVLGALLSKMDTPERYYIQLALVGLIVSLSMVSAIASLHQKLWGICIMGLLFGVAAVFWLSAAAGLAFATVADPTSLSIALFLAAIGLVCAWFTIAVFQDYQRFKLHKVSAVHAHDA